MAITLSATELSSIDFGGTRSRVDFTKYSTGETVALVEGDDFAYVQKGESSSCDLTATSHAAFKLKAYNWGRKNGYRLARFSKPATIKGKGCIVLQFVKVAKVVETPSADVPAEKVVENGSGDSKNVSTEKVEKVAA